MFKRFHQTYQPPKKKQKEKEVFTYTQLNQMGQEKKKNLNNTSQYSHRHQKAKMENELSFANTAPTLECIKTDKYLFQGIVKGKVKDGQGIMMHRNGTVIIGTWANGQLDGRALIFAPFRARIFCHFNQGKLSGWAISFYSTNIIRCTLYYENQVDGQKFTFDSREKMWVASKCAPDGHVLSLVHAQKGNKHQMPSFIRSQQLRDIYSHCVVGGQKFLDLNILQQFDISLATSYIGFVDEEKRPCGMGCAFSEQEMYCGNFFEGVLQHYGRMMFQNGDIYQGELMSGSFWGRGMYYSPTKNQTSILMTNQYEQAIEGQFTGYVMIDIPPPIGTMVSYSQTGIKGDALRKAIQNMEPYYLKEFTTFNQMKVKTKSNTSEYGKSEDAQVVMKDGKQVQVRKEKKEELVSPSFSPKGNQEKWITAEQAQNNEETLRKTMSLDKREAQRRKGQEVHFYDKKAAKQMRQNSAAREELEGGKSNTMMTEIRLGKSDVHDNLNPRNMTTSDEKQKGMKRWTDKMNQNDISEIVSQGSVKSKNMAAMFDKNKSYRKKIF